MDQDNVKLMFDLIKSSVCDVMLTEDEKKKATDASVKEVIKLSSVHYVHHIVFDGLYKNGLISHQHKYYDKLQQMQVMMMGQYEKIKYSFAELCGYFEQEKIAFMPLKDLGL